MRSILKASIKGSNFKLAFLLLFMTVQVVVTLVIPVELQHFIDGSGPSAAALVLFIALASYFILNILAELLDIFLAYMAQSIGWRIFNKVRSKVLSKILDYDQYFFDTHSSGEILEYLERDIQTLYSFFTDQLLQIIVNFGMLAGILVVLFVKSLLIGTVFLVYVALSFFFIFKSTFQDKDILDEYQGVQSYNLGKYGEWLEARKDLSALGEKSYVEQKMSKMDKAYRHAEVRSEAYLYRIWSITLLLVVVANGLIFLISGKLYFLHLISLGTVYLMYTYSNMLRTPFEYFQVQFKAFLSARAAYRRMEEMLGYQAEVKDGKESRIPMVPDIQFCNVSYTYRGAKPGQAALSHVSLTLPAGSTLGIVGHSGSGKSTFCKLLCKMLEPTEGLITIQGQSLSHISVESWRKNMAYISTGAPVFRGTLKDNLTMYHPHIAEEEIKDRLKKYGLLSHFEDINTNSHKEENKGFAEKDFLAFSIDEQGISNGQRQLIGIGRVLFSDAKVVVFDEASSKIDPLIRSCFLGMIGLMKQERTVIVVSHDVEMLGVCDEIAVFEHARIVEHGKREELECNARSRYRKILEMRGGLS